MISCSKCKREFKKEGESRMVASISGSIMGDECIESYFFCQHCGVYTLEIYWDMFLGEETSSVHGPISKEEGDAKVELIRQCSRPWDKKCRCPAHLAYFGGSLD
jgi:hypothetical protein